MQYALLVYNDPTAWSSLSKEEMQNATAAWKAYSEALKTSGAWMNSHGLAGPDNATTVRVRNGKSQVLNGPYADSKEQLGGIVVIEVPDLDAALSWAARCPSAERGLVEVRPLWGQ